MVLAGVMNETKRSKKRKHTIWTEDEGGFYDKHCREALFSSWPISHDGGNNRFM